MTEKELRKLKRSDFLQLLLAQSKEMAAVQARLDETTDELTKLRANNEHLNAQNELIEQLKGNLDSKDETINALRQELEAMKHGRLSKTGFAAKKTAPTHGDPDKMPNGMRKVGRKALDQRLYQLRAKRDGLMNKCKTATAALREKAKQKLPAKGSAAEEAETEKKARPALKARLTAPLRKHKEK